MSRTIDADVLKKDLSRFYDGEVTAKELIDEQPTVNDWISVEDRLPAEIHSIFWPLYGKKEWSKAMWREQSDKVLVTVAFADGMKIVTTGETHDGVWSTAISRMFEHVVTHWMPMPEPPERERGKQG